MAFRTKDRPAWQHSCVILPSTTYKGRRLWENPFVKLASLHGYRQPLSMGAFWVIRCLTRRSTQHVLEKGFRRILHLYALKKTPKHTYALTSLPSACLLSEHITHSPSTLSLAVKEAHSAADAIGRAVARWHNVDSNADKVAMFQTALSWGFKWAVIILVHS